MTNAQYVAIVDAAGLESERRGGSVHLNVFNPDLPVTADAVGRHRIRPGYADHPVAGVSWTGAALAASAVGARLPTVEEWRWAAGNGGRTAYPWGDRPPEPGLANYAEHVGGTTPVGRYPASAWGFADLGGTNESAIHSDIVKDLRPGGRIEVDGRVVQENGAWVS